MSFIIGQVIPDQCALFALEIEKLNFSVLFGVSLHCLPVLVSTKVSDIGPSWPSCYCCWICIIMNIKQIVYYCCWNCIDTNRKLS